MYRYLFCIHSPRLLLLFICSFFIYVQALPIVTDPEMAERFERELTWCVGQLECILRSSSSKDRDPRRSYLIASSIHRLSR
jgi:hypothetical protein